MNTPKKTWRQHIEQQDPKLLAYYDSLSPDQLAAVHASVQSTPTPGRWAAILQILIQAGPQMAALIESLIKIFSTTAVLVLTLCLNTCLLGADPPPRVGVHVDATGKAHKCTGLKPLKPGAYSQLKAAVERRPRPTPTPPKITPVDLREKSPEILDQNGWNCCAGCSGTMGHRLAEIIAGNPDPKDSVADLYDRCNDGVDEGADLSTCINAMTTPGVAPTSLVPNYQIPIESPCPGCAAARAANPLEHATFCPDQPSMLAAVEAGTPVYFGIIVTNKFNPDQSGYIGPYGGIAEGGHAVLAVGVSATANGYAYITQNSWGADWGNKGFCLLDSSWAQPQVYGAFALSGEKRQTPIIAHATVASPPAPSGTKDIVMAVYRWPGTPSPQSAALGLIGSASSSLRLATWHLSDGSIGQALCTAATNGLSVQVAYDLSGGTETAQHKIIAQIKASGGTCWSCHFPKKIANNFLEADGVYTLNGSYYYSPTAVQAGTYTLAVSGTPAAAAAIAQFSALIASGTLASTAPPGRDESHWTLCGSDPSPPLPNSCPSCPNAATTPPPREVQLDVGPVHWIWRSTRYQYTSARSVPRPGISRVGPIRRLAAWFRYRRS